MFSFTPEWGNEVAMFGVKGGKFLSRSRRQRKVVVFLGTSPRVVVFRDEVPPCEDEWMVFESKKGGMPFFLIYILHTSHQPP